MRAREICENLDPAESGSIFRVGELRDDETGQPGYEQALVEARHEVDRLPEAVRRSDGTDDEQSGQVEMRDEVRDELHHRHAVEPVTERQGEDQPDGRQKQRGEEERHHAAAAPVGQVPGPDLREVLLDGLVRHDVLLLAVDEQVEDRDAAVIDGT